MTNPSSSLCPDTASGSFLHWLSRRWGPVRIKTLVVAYLTSAAIAYIPIAIAATLGTVPLLNASRPTTLTFLHDWGLCFALLVSLPTLVVLLVTDEQLLLGSVRQVQADGVILLNETQPALVTKMWSEKFRTWNVRGQRFAVAVGIILGAVTYLLQRHADLNSWIAPQDGSKVAGIAYLYGVTLIYIVVTFYIIRCIAVSRFLADLVDRAPLRILPLHPDKCGGLRPVGRIGLRNQYTLTVLGLNIVILLAVWISMNETASLRPVMIAATVAYLIFGPLVFMAPLLPFRAGMMQAKERWTREVAQVVRREIDTLREHMHASGITKNDEESIERLRKVGEVIDDLPVWPFDARTLRKFATAYLVPIGATIATNLAHLFFPSWFH